MRTARLPPSNTQGSPKTRKPSAGERVQQRRVIPFPNADRVRVKRKCNDGKSPRDKAFEYRDLLWRKFVHEFLISNLKFQMKISN